MSVHEPNPRRPCSRCRTRTRAVAGLCPSCEATLEGGCWVRVGLISHWVPAGHTLATHRALRARLRAVAAERYAVPTWWPTPPHDDSELTCARRLREAITEADEHEDHRRRGAVA